MDASLEIVADGCLRDAILRRPWRRIADLLSQTFDLCPVSDINPEAEAALKQLQTALTAENFAKVEKRLAAVREKTR